MSNAQDCPECARDADFLRTSRPFREAAGAEEGAPIRVVDLFAGAGGLSLGFAEGCRRARISFEAALAVDTNALALKAFEANLPTQRAELSPVEALFDGALGAKPTRGEKALRRSIGTIDVLLGGPPCQGVSSLNNHTRMADSRNALYARMARAAEVLLPRVVVVENVPGAAHDTAHVVASTVATLVAAGYQTRSLVIDMSLLGVPQRRKRLVVIGMRADADSTIGLAAISKRCSHVRTVRWAIEDLLNPAPRPEFDEPAWFDTPNRLTKRSRKRIEYLHKQDRYDLPNELRPPCHMKAHSYRSMYGRLKWDEPAQTITSGFGSMGQGRYVHPSEARTLTAHEAARLQTFPDSFAFPPGVTRTSLAELIANAVPPLANAAIAETLLESVQGLKRSAVKNDAAA